MSILPGVNLDAPLFEGSLAESLHQLSEWRNSRFGVSSPKPFSQKLHHCCNIVAANKFGFITLIVIYFVAETMGNATLLLLQWAIDKDAPRDGHLLLVQLTASWPVRVWVSLLNGLVLYAVLQALKRRGNELSLSDIVGMRTVISWKICVAMFISDILLSSPLAIAQALLESDLRWAAIYVLIGFVLNWLFGMAQVLIFEDPNLSVLSCFVWSAAMALDTSTFCPVILTYAFVFVATPLLVTTPVLIVLQLLTFFELFGYRSPAEVYYAPQAGE
jgi:hypothetical protein